MARRLSPLSPRPAPRLSSSRHSSARPVRTLRAVPMTGPFGARSSLLQNTNQPARLSRSLTTAGVSAYRVHHEVRFGLAHTRAVCECLWKVVAFSYRARFVPLCIAVPKRNVFGFSARTEVFPSSPPGVLDAVIWQYRRPDLSRGVRTRCPQRRPVTVFPSPISTKSYRYLT